MAVDESLDVRVLIFFCGRQGRENRTELVNSFIQRYDFGVRAEYARRSTVEL